MKVPEGAMGGREAERIKSRVREQFGRQFAYYAESEFHARGADLDTLVDMVGPHRDDVVLDVATGAGHTAFKFSPLVKYVIATDITERMLELAEAIAKDRGITNITFKVADVESLPFRDESFDLVTCRSAFHHFADPIRALREMKRVMRVNGRIALADTVAPDDRIGESIQNRMESLRDPSHVKDHPLSEIQAMCDGLGLEIVDLKLIEKTFDFEDWVRGAGTPPDAVNELRRFLEGEAKDIFKVQRDGNNFFFTWIRALAILTRK
ncbi:MAG: class I SAM-dependent methyltransferase [bacterium]